MFEIISKDEALKLFDEGREVFKIYDDVPEGSEGAVACRREIEQHGRDFGVELGFRDTPPLCSCGKRLIYSADSALTWECLCGKRYKYFK